jgi:hypothetical protein
MWDILNFHCLILALQKGETSLLSYYAEFCGGYVVSFVSMAVESEGRLLECRPAVCGDADLSTLLFADKLQTVS